jgi:hypothetical protein
MSFSLASFPWISAVVVAVLAGGAQGAEPHRGRSIEFSEPRSAETLTNLNLLTTKKDGLKQLEEDLYRPLETFAPKTSLEGFFDPPEQRRRPVSAAQSKRAKELLERQKNWVFLDPDNQATGLTAEQIFNLPEYDADGQEKKKLSVFEQYLENQERKRTGKTKSGKTRAENLAGSNKDEASRDDAGNTDDVKGYGEREQSLKKSFGNEFGNNPAALGRGTFTDIFGLGEKTPSAEDAAKHKAYMSEFQSLLNSGWQAPAESFGGLADPARTTAGTVGALDSLPGLSRRESSSSFSGATPTFNSTPARTTLQDFNVKSSSLPNVTPAPATKVTPPTPTFTAPRRAF